MNTEKKIPISVNKEILTALVIQPHLKNQQLYTQDEWRKIQELLQHEIVNTVIYPLFSALKKALDN